MMKNLQFKIILICCFIAFSFATTISQSHAQENTVLDCVAPECCTPYLEECSGQTSCSCQSILETGELSIGTFEQGVIEEGFGTLFHVQRAFVLHREWWIKNVWEAHVLPSMMLSTQQIGQMALLQMEVIGGFFDAKHQLETQRLLQDLQSVAHKQYQPSTGMCRFGTTTRSLAAAERQAEFNQIAIADSANERALLSDLSLGTGGERDDRRSRREEFRDVYCNAADLGGALDEICRNTNVERKNKDINFTHTIDYSETLDVDFSDSVLTDVERHVLALQTNLYGPNLLPVIGEDYLIDDAGNVLSKGTGLYLDTRALAAKRSVARNSYAAQVGLKSLGASAVLPYMTEILDEMGVPAAEILGERPSYHAQMEVLTKKMYQYPTFYADLYDKPANIDRKNVSMQAIGLMQKRDLYRSQLRSEANSAIWLETLLEEHQSYHENKAAGFTENSRLLLNLGLGGLGGP